MPIPLTDPGDDRSSGAPGDFFIAQLAQQFFFRPCPIFPLRLWLKRRDVEAQTLVTHLIVAAAQASRQFGVIKLSNELQLPPCPRPRRSEQADASPFALLYDRFDGATGAAGKDRVRHPAKLGSVSTAPRL